MHHECYTHCKNSLCGPSTGFRCQTGGTTSYRWATLGQWYWYGGAGPGYLRMWIYTLQCKCMEIHLIKYKNFEYTVAVIFLAFLFYSLTVILQPHFVTLSHVIAVWQSSQIFIFQSWNQVISMKNFILFMILGPQSGETCQTAAAFWSWHWDWTRISHSSGIHTETAYKLSTWHFEQ